MVDEQAYNGGYADSSFEDFLEITKLFDTADGADERMQEVADTVQQKIDTLALRLNQVAPEVIVPPRGFLQRKLDERQRRGLNTMLGAEYARVNALHQKDLENIPIREGKEKMVYLPDVLKDRADPEWSDKPFHPACGPCAKQKRIFWMREEAAQKIAQAFNALDQINLTANVDDCFRPPQVQEGLFIRRVMTLAKNHRTWEPQQVQLLARSFTGPNPGGAGHQAGAAIDWRLLNKNKKLLDLGNDYAEGGIIASLDNPYLTAAQWETRQIFMHLMQMVGMKLLRTENWHASFGDRGMGKDGDIKSQVAYYAPIREFDSKDGSIKKGYRGQEIDKDYVPLKQIEAIMEISRNHHKQQQAEQETVSADHFNLEEYKEVIAQLRKMRRHGRSIERLKNWFPEEKK